MDQAPGALSLPLTSPDEREAALHTRLREFGIAWTTHVHAPVFTVAQAAHLYASQPGGHTKNLFLKDKKSGLWLVVARDELKIDLNELAKALGAPRFSFGSAELLFEVLGVTPGSVTPFAAINDRDGRVTVVLQQAMLASDPLNYHPLRNDRTTAISPGDLVRFLDACGHAARIVDIPSRIG